MFEDSLLLSGCEVKAEYGSRACRKKVKKKGENFLLIE